MKAIGFGIAAILMVAASGTASFLENTTGVCYQNDGQTTFDMQCDMPDSIGAILGQGSDAPQCNTMVGEEPAETVGTLVPPHELAGAPQEDPSDFCVANLFPTIPAGTRITISLHTADVDTGFDVSLHLWDPETGQEVTGPAGPAAAALDAGSAEEEPLAPAPVHSGKVHKPFSPISVSQVFVDGTGQTSLGKSFQEVAVLDFVVKNEPHYMTSNGTQSVLRAGDAVRLCDYSGTLSFSLSEGGGNIKFDGQATRVEVAQGIGLLTACAGHEIQPNIECAIDPGTQTATQCSLTVTPLLPVLLFEARGHPIPPPKLGFQAQPRHCHDVCNFIGMDMLPSDWGLNLFPSSEE